MSLLPEMVKYIFREFNKNQISYCVLRNYESLPDDLGGHDIDILINRKNKSTVHQILRSLTDKFHITCIRIGERQYVISYYMVYTEHSERTMLQIDLFFDLDWHGRTMLDADSILSSCITYNGISIPRPAHEAATSLFSSLIRGGFYKKRYHESIKRLITEDFNEFKKVLGDSVGEYADELISLIKNDDTKGCESLVPVLRRNITFSSLKRFPAKTLSDMVRFLFWEIRNRMKPSGDLYAIIGGSSDERYQFASRLLPLIEKYYKNEGDMNKFIFFSESITNRDVGLISIINYWKHYFKVVHKKLNKTYGLIYCGYFCDETAYQNGRLVKQPDLCFAVTDIYGSSYTSRVVRVTDEIDIEKEVINTIAGGDTSRYPGFVKKL